jgi:hypothetical protein
MNMKKHWASVAPTAVLLAACTTPMFTMPPGPHDYRVGFHDGCDAGYAYADSPFYAPADAAAPASSDEPYVSGWQSGFEQCRGSFQRIQRTVSTVLGPP